jgi:hypothetical protein
LACTLNPTPSLPSTAAAARAPPDRQQVRIARGTGDVGVQHLGKTADDIHGLTFDDARCPG